MKKVLLALIFTLLVTLSSFATTITIGATQIPNWTFGGTRASLRIYPSTTFTTSGNQTILGGTASGFYRTIDCTLASQVVSCPSFTIDSTTDSSIPTAYYTANLYDGSGRSRAIFFSSFRVPTSFGTSVTWEQLRSYNASLPIPLPSTYYTSDQVNALLAANASGFSLNSLTGPAQTLATGSTGSDFGISSVGTTHTFNLPTASTSNRGALSASDWSTFNAKKTDSMATNRLLGRGTAGTGAIEEITLGTNLSLTGTTLNATGGGGGGSSVPGSLFCDGTKLQHVNLGVFFAPNTHYGQFLYEAWVKPSSLGPNGTNYFLSDDHGGNHNILWGLSYASGVGAASGNVYAGPDAAVPVSVVDTVNSSFTATAHGFFSEQRVNVSSTGTIPAGLNGATVYYIVKIDANTFKLAASIEDAIYSDGHFSTPHIVTVTTTGSGTVSFTPIGLTSFDSAETFPLDHWLHLAVQWDGTSIMTWINGILSSVQPFAPAYTFQGGGSDPDLYVCGSDHNNWTGNIAQLRLSNGSGAPRFTADFPPERFFRPTYFTSGTTRHWANFVMHFTSPQTLYVDRGAGFDGQTHDGVPEALYSVLGMDVNSAAYTPTALGLPTFQSGDVTPGDYVPTPPATPSGAIIWDSFSRADRTYSNPTDPISGGFTLGQTEAGSAGVKTWAHADGTALTNGAGVLNGRAFIVYAAIFPYDGPAVDTGTQDVDVRVDRIPSYYGQTGETIRYKDANNWYYVFGTNVFITVFKDEAGVTSSATCEPTAGWTTLRTVAKGTAFSVYTGTATEGSFTLCTSFTGTNVTGATVDGITRDSNVKSVWRYDNFLVKAAP